MNLSEERTGNGAGATARKLKPFRRPATELTAPAFDIMKPYIPGVPEKITLTIMSRWTWNPKDVLARLERMDGRDAIDICDFVPGYDTPPNPSQMAELKGYLVLSKNSTGS